MKNPVTAMGALSTVGEMNSTVAGVFEKAANLASVVWAGLRKAVTAMQVARMQSIIMGMSDEQLAQINVERKDALTYGRSLIVRSDA
ncbi:MAG: hypothetical protein WBC85_02760 [Planktotalea sp.]|uniref:hypothetical protein n=1 Tax=Planktotalea sp. TaxID=2029877 RepID=UPI003C78D828